MKEFTDQQIINWLASDSETDIDGLSSIDDVSKTDLINVIRNLANNKFELKHLKEEIEYANKEKEYIVTLAQTVYTAQDIKVKARNAEHAEQLAKEIASESDNWKFCDQETFVNGIILNCPVLPQ